MRIYPIGLAVVLSLALAGCHLIDQTDIDPKPAVTAQRPPIPEAETRPALVTIDYATSNPDYAAALGTAIRAAESRRPDLLYDVVAVVGDPGEAPAGSAHAAEVMTKIEAQGVLPSRIELGLRIDSGRKVQQVRVYLR